ncbi:MAG TPA: outer membrane beta-barrel protein, partial [Terriglobia bacterium]|nr:outer membrane beta-barrel protein [Terriglobia bacterium]
MMKTTQAFRVSGLLLFLALSLTPALLSQTAEGTPTTGQLERQIEQLQKQLGELKAEIAAMKQQQIAPQSSQNGPARSATAADAQTPAASPASAAPAVPATAENSSPTAKPAASLFSSTAITGFVDTYYGYNFNQPANRTSTLRAFDGPANQFSLNMTELTISRAPDANVSRLGYDLTFGYGNAMNVVNASDPGGLGFAQYLKEAYASYLVPVGKGLQIDFGKFVTPAGAEVIETKDDWNYSRGFLFSYAIPFYHFGLRAKYALNDKVSLTGYLVNGWNDVVDNNTGKTYGLSLAWNPSKKFSLIENYLAGPEMADRNSPWRQLTDTVAQYNVTSKLSLLGNFDWGGGDLVPGRTGAAFWTGVAGYVRYAFNDRYTLATRYEYYDDHDGFTTGTAQNLNE